MKKIAAIVILFLFVIQPVRSDMEAVMKNGLEARGQSMGQAQVAEIGNPHIGYWNPASIARIKGIQFLSSAADFYGVAYKTVSLVFPAVTGNVGVLVATANQGGIIETTLDASQRPIATGNNFGYDAGACYVSFAKNFGKVLAGANVKYFAEKLSARGSNGMGMDVGVVLKPSEAFSLGMNVENAVVPQVKWDTASGNVDQPNSKVRFGASVHPVSGKYSLNGDVAVSKDQAEIFMGGEYNLLPNFALRGGMSRGMPAIGVGVDYKGVNVDYSYVKGNDYLEDAHRINLVLNFEEKPHIGTSIAKAPESLSFEAPVVIMPLAPAVKKEMEIAFYSETAFPGRKFHYKVVTMGVMAERVSVSFGERIVNLYSNDRVNWKGDSSISSSIRPGNYPLKIYVADIDGHLYSERVNVCVEAVPEVNIIRASFQPAKVNTFTAKVPPQIDKATLSLGGKLVPLIISKGLASASFYLEHLPQNSHLYLADRSGHVFVCSLVSDVGNPFVEQKTKGWGLNWWLIAVVLLLGLWLLPRLRRSRDRWR